MHWGVRKSSRAATIPAASAVGVPAGHLAGLRRAVSIWGSYTWGYADVGADIYVALGLVIGAATLPFSPWRRPGILQVAEEERVDAVVLGVGVKSRVPGEWGKTSEEILRRANCKVVLDKAPIATRSTPVGAQV